MVLDARIPRNDRQPCPRLRGECPVLLVHARGDEQVPVAHSIALAACLRTDTTLLALEGGSHTTAQHDPAVTAYTLRWLLEATKATKTAD